MEKIQTAVEYLLEKYKSQNTLLFAEDFEQAKEMERQKEKKFNQQLEMLNKSWKEYCKTNFKSK